MTIPLFGGGRAIIGGRRVLDTIPTWEARRENSMSVAVRVVEWLPWCVWCGYYELGHASE